MELELDQMYDEYFGLLVEFAANKGISRDEAEHLSHEVLLASLLQLPRIEHIDEWFHGAMIHAVANRQARGSSV